MEGLHLIPFLHGGSISTLGCLDLVRRWWGAEGKSKLARTAWSGAPAPCFVNNDHVATEHSYSTAHALHTVTTWLGATLQEECVGSTQESGVLLRGHSCVHQTRRERGDYRVSPATAAGPTRGAPPCLQSLWLLESSSSLPAGAAPTLGSTNCAGWDTARQLASPTGSVT